MVPMGVSMARAMQSTRLWVTGMPSSVKGPTAKRSPGTISTSSVDCSSLCSLNLWRRKPRVRRVPYTGTWETLQDVGQGAPMWSSCA